jgi:hypothetical protein
VKVQDTIKLIIFIKSKNGNLGSKKKVREITCSCMTKYVDVPTDVGHQKLLQELHNP